MFEPDYTETMSMLLDTINRQRNYVLPLEGSDAEVAQSTKSQDELSAAGGMEKSEDECSREISPISIPGQASEYNWLDGSERGELDFADSITGEFSNKA